MALAMGDDRTFDVGLGIGAFTVHFFESGFSGDDRAGFYFSVVFSVEEER